jgi:hypothetical protein
VKGITGVGGLACQDTLCWCLDTQWGIALRVWDAWEGCSCLMFGPGAVLSFAAIDAQPLYAAPSHLGEHPSRRRTISRDPLFRH